MKVIVTGANGQLGNSIREIADENKKIKFVFTDIDELDITNEKEVIKFFNSEKPDWVINAAAYTAVDKAEQDQDKAELINSKAVEILSKASYDVCASIIHISTDYVFGGDNPSPIKEDEKVNPLSVYGKTKYQGELAAQKNPHHIIIRTSWLYSIYGANFVKTMLRLGSEKDTLSIVSDQWGTPTSAHDLARAIVSVIMTPKPNWGIYNYSNEGVANWALFAEMIMEYAGLNCKVEHITTDQYPTAAKRPHYSILDKSKIKDNFKITIPEWESSLHDVIGKLKE